MDKPFNLNYANRQHGIALITGLIFLVVLTLISVTAARMAGLEDGMSGNLRDRAIAMQAAEAALRDAERDILSGTAVTRNPKISGITAFDALCTDGLCYNGTQGNSDGVDWNANPVWSLVSMTAAPSVRLGTYTGARDIDGVFDQPRYLIEGFQKTESGEVVYFYRITARAVGANPNTVVWLQEVFRL